MEESRKQVLKNDISLVSCSSQGSNTKTTFNSTDDNCKDFVYDDGHVCEFEHEVVAKKVFKDNTIADCTNGMTLFENNDRFIDSHDVLGDNVMLIDEDDVAEHATNKDININNRDVTGDEAVGTRDCGGHEVVIPIDNVVQQLDMKEEAINNSDVTGDEAVVTRDCGGHEVAIPIDKVVQQLDMKEEAIETLLCYLELHPKRWIQILKSIRATCTLKFYGGPAHLYYVTQRVPIVAAAVAFARKRGEFKVKTSTLTFPVVKIIDEMGWDLEPVRRELYGLQWNEGLRLPGETGLSTGHSGIVVEFSDLAFHIEAPGDLKGEEIDEVSMLLLYNFSGIIEKYSSFRYDVISCHSIPSPSPRFRPYPPSVTSSPLRHPTFRHYPLSVTPPSFTTSSPNIEKCNIFLLTFQYRYVIFSKIV